MREKIRDIVSRHGKLRVPMERLDDAADLFSNGMDSLAVVDVMLSIEETFGLEFPDTLLNRGSFSTIASLESAVLSVSR